MDPKERIKTLAEELTRHQHLYYVLAEPAISDSRYDALFDELAELERRYPQYRLPDSPTQRVGSDLDQSFPQKPHQAPVLSLDKANTPLQLLSWVEKIRLQHPEIELIMEDKIDGLSIVLHYQGGLLVSALTRGDGERGNEIGENVKTIRQIPLRVSCSEPFIVRGEIYLEKEDFARLNQDQDKRFANPRNLAAGSIRLSRSSQVARIPLKFATHDAHFPDNPGQTHLDNLIRLHLLGFPLIRPIRLIGSKTHPLDAKIPELIPIGFAEIGEAIESIRRERPHRSYEIDGLVFKVNQHRLRNELGNTSHHPRWAMAFKFDAPGAETRLLSIDIQVGRNGRITPVANLEPVLISGSTVSRATLHNQLNIDTLNVGPGDLVAVSKRGDVIPAVDEVIQKANDGPGVFSMPSRCPVCRSELQIQGAHHFCVNRSCPERMKKQIIFFAAKGQMDIAGIGEQTIRQLFDLGYIRTVVDLYRFDYHRLVGLPGYGPRKIHNIIDSLKASKERPFFALLTALGIEGLGPRSARILVENGFDSMTKILTASAGEEIERLAGIPGFGPVLTRALHEYFKDPENRELIRQLAEQGLPTEEASPGQKAPGGPLSGQTWVITGSFSSFQPREKAAEQIRNLGGSVSGSVSSKTTHLLAGEKPGAKMDKAQELGIRIVSETRFLEMLREISAP